MVRRLIIGVVLTCVTGCNLDNFEPDTSYNFTQNELATAHGDSVAALAYTAMSTKPGGDNKPSPDGKATVCPNCDGAGKVGDGRVMLTCKVCNGTGKVTKKTVPPAQAEELEQPKAPAQSTDDFVRLSSETSDLITAAVKAAFQEPIGQFTDLSLGDAFRSNLRASTMEYADEPLSMPHWAEAVPTGLSKLKQTIKAVDRDNTPVTLVVAVVKDSPAHVKVHSEVLPGLPTNWVIRYVFYDADKPLNNKVYPKYYIRYKAASLSSSGDITTAGLLGKITAAATLDTPTKN